MNKKQIIKKIKELAFDYKPSKEKGGWYSSDSEAAYYDGLDAAKEDMYEDLQDLLKEIENE